MSLRAHFVALASAWRSESARRRRRHRWVETEFLPAALEVVETPPSPAGRLVLWTILALSVGALLWACLSRVDTVAVAEGRLTPAGRLRSVEPADAGIVRAIAVREGDAVTAGQLLISLDPTFAEADAGAAETELQAAALGRARARALLQSLSGSPAALQAPDGAPHAAVVAEQAVVDARTREYAARRGGLLERQSAARASVRVSEANIARLKQTLPLVRQQLEAYETLTLNGFGARLRLAHEQERYVTLQHDLEAEMARRDEAAAQVASLTQEIAQAEHEFRSHAAREAAEAEAVVSTRTEELRKAAQRRALQTLRAPVSGVVQEVAVTTLGQVAEAGKPLVTIVPQGEELVAEVLVLNRDVGAVKVGDEAVLKLEAFPFTRYGTIRGLVERISPDAIIDERRGLVFPATIRFNASALEGRRLHTAAGMSLNAEIITGRRRVIEYLWSPVARAMAEAGRER